MSQASTSSSEHLAFASFAQHLADIARSVSTSYFRRPLAVEHKADDSPVTVADRETEAAMRSLILESYPEHGLFGEEYGSVGEDCHYTWVIDPIDGTKSFITGMPLYGTLIALLENGCPVIGVIDMPALGERWVGVKGQPTLFNGLPVNTRPCAELAKTIWCTTSPDLFTGVDKTKYEALTAATSLRRFGGDCYAYGLLASGFVDLVLEAQLQPYDYLALVPVIEGAGGRVTDWKGLALGLHSSGHVLATGNAELHDKALALLCD